MAQSRKSSSLKRELKILKAYWDLKFNFLGSKTENKEAFFERVGEIFPKWDPRYQRIEKAYDAAQRMFRLKKRDNGEQYFEHLRGTALLALVHFRQTNADLIAGALLHDSKEDIKDVTFDWLASEFSPQVASYVYWLTKPEIGGKYPTASDVDRKSHRNLKRAEQVEVVLIRICDRLHNLWTIWDQDPERIRRKLLETRDFLLPLAEEYGVGVHELDDILRILEAEKFT